MGESKKEQFYTMSSNIKKLQATIDSLHKSNSAYKLQYTSAQDGMINAKKVLVSQQKQIIQLQQDKKQLEEKYVTNEEKLNQVEKQVDTVRNEMKIQLDDTLCKLEQASSSLSKLESQNILRDSITIYIESTTTLVKTGQELLANINFLNNFDPSTLDPKDLSLRWSRSFKGSYFNDIEGELGSARNYTTSCDDIGAILKVTLSIADNFTTTAEIGPIYPSDDIITAINNISKKSEVECTVFSAHDPTTAKSIQFNKNKVKLRSKNKTTTKAEWSDLFDIKLSIDSINEFIILLGNGTPYISFLVQDNVSRDIIVTTARWFYFKFYKNAKNISDQTASLIYWLNQLTKLIVANDKVDADESKMVNRSAIINESSNNTLNESSNNTLNDTSTILNDTSNHINNDNDNDDDDDNQLDNEVDWSDDDDDNNKKEIDDQDEEEKQPKYEIKMRETAIKKPDAKVLADIARKSFIAVPNKSSSIRKTRRSNIITNNDNPSSSSSLSSSSSKKVVQKKKKKKRKIVHKIRANNNENDDYLIFVSVTENLIAKFKEDGTIISYNVIGQIHVKSMKKLKQDTKIIIDLSYADKKKYITRYHDMISHLHDHLYTIDIAANNDNPILICDYKYIASDQDQNIYIPLQAKSIWKNQDNICKFQIQVMDTSNDFNIKLSKLRIATVLQPPNAINQLIHTHPSAEYISHRQSLLWSYKTFPLINTSDNTSLKKVTINAALNTNQILEHVPIHFSFNSDQVDRSICEFNIKPVQNHEIYPTVSKIFHRIKCNTYTIIK